MSEFSWSVAVDTNDTTIDGQEVQGFCTSSKTTVDEVVPLTETATKGRRSQFNQRSVGQNSTAKSSSKSSKKQRATSSTQAQKPTVDKILALAHQLSQIELSELIDGLTQLREARDEQLNDDQDEREDYGKKHGRSSRGRSARVEAKMINGCGPYDYLRWWSDGKHRSTYLGKSRN